MEGDALRSGHPNYLWNVEFVVSRDGITPALGWEGKMGGGAREQLVIRLG